MLTTDGAQAWAVRVLGDEIRAENSGLRKAQKQSEITKQCFLCSSLTVFVVHRKKATSRLLAKSQ